MRDADDSAAWQLGLLCSGIALVFVGYGLTHDTVMGIGWIAVAIGLIVYLIKKIGELKGSSSDSGSSSSSDSGGSDSGSSSSNSGGGSSSGSSSEGGNNSGENQPEGPAPANPQISSVNIENGEMEGRLA